MDNRIKALEVLCILEMGILSIISIKSAAVVIVLSFVFAIRYTYLFICRQNRRKRRKKKKHRSNSNRTLSYDLLVQERVSKQISNTVSKEAETSLTKDEIFERSFLQQDIPFSDIDLLSGEEFESVIYNRLKSMGYVVYFTPTSQDYGADLIIQTEKGSIVVQCKRYKSTHSVGVSAVQEVLGAIVYYHAQVAVVVTNAMFTENAKKLARTSKNVVLWDREYLKKNFGFVETVI